MKKVIKMSYFKIYNKIVNESVLGRIGRGISWARNPANPHNAVKNNEYRQRELDRRMEREHKVDYGLDEIYKDDTDKKDYPDLSKQYVHV